MGLAGSGKSVQGELLSKELGCPMLATGQYLRDHLGAERREEMLAGKLLDDAEIIDMVADMLTKNGAERGCVLDGFPRSIPQAQWLLDQHKKGLVHIDGIIHLQAPPEVVRDRLLHRGRPDDRDDAINERIKEYREVTLPAVELLHTENIPVHSINGVQPIEKVHQDIMSAIAA